uniref:Uncharacterized protein At2g37660, chloroplastic n=1 Tax=Anthurium amnicola TaxID=1678845 RepID=A0A1D1YVA0_9ARAE
MALLSSHLSTAASRHHLPRLPGAVLAPSLLLQGKPRPPPTSCSAKKKEASFTDRILDYIEGGPKLRKWYGAPDLLPKDGDSEAGEDGDEEVEEVRDAVLVTDGDSEIGQPIVGDASSKSFLKKAFRGVRAIVCPSNEGFLSDVGQMKGVEHIVLLSQLAAYKGCSGLQALMNNKARKLAESDEEAVIASGIPYTIIRAALLQNSPGGNQGFIFKEGVAATGRLSKEDAALICVEALDTIPQKGLVLEVANGEEKVSDWKERFASFLNRPNQSR